MSPFALRRYRAERLLRNDFAARRAKVLSIVRSRLRARGVTLDPADLEACYAQAWHGLYAAVLGGEQIEDPAAWLVLVTFRRAIDESRAHARFRAGGEPARALELTPDVAAQLDDRARLRELFEGLRGRLGRRECEAASLCYLQGLSRAQAAARMGISEARMRKLMDGTRASPGVAGKVGELLATIRAGAWCEQQGSLMRAYAFGVLDPDGERHALAVVHLRECPACRVHVACWRGLASVLPPLPLPLATAGGAGSTAGSGAGASAPAGSGAVMRTGTGWTGLAGSLTAKLAVTGLVVLGGGYALLAGGAHGHSLAHNRRPQAPAPPHHSRPSARRPRTVARKVSNVARPAHARARTRARGTPTASTHTSQAPPPPPPPPASATPSPGIAPLGEFTPERVPRGH